MTNPIMLGTAERIPPDVKCGDVCRVHGVQGLWVPFARAGGRSDGDVTRFYGWRFLRYPEGNVARTFPIHNVSEIVHPVGTKESERFWPIVEEFTS